MYMSDSLICMLFDNAFCPNEFSINQTNFNLCGITGLDLRKK